MNVGYIFSHGWAYDSSYWDNILPHFSNHNCIILDQGYYKKTALNTIQNLDPKIRWVGIGHSLGFIKLLQHSAHLDAIIGLQAFHCFLGNDKQIKKRRLIELNLIRQSFINNPIETLSKFIEFRKTNLNFDILLNDLDLLFSDYAHLMPDIVPILILYTNDDTVVPSGIISDNFANIGNIRIKQLSASQHRLGMYNSEQVATQIKNFIQCLSTK